MHKVFKNKAQRCSTPLTWSTLSLEWCASRGAHLLFSSNWARLLNFIMLLWEGRQSSTQRACYLPSLSMYPFIHLGWEEQVSCWRTEHAGPHRVHTTLGSWVGSCNAELCVPLGPCAWNAHAMSVWGKIFTRVQKKQLKCIEEKNNNILSILKVGLTFE